MSRYRGKTPDRGLLIAAWAGLSMSIPMTAAAEDGPTLDRNPGVAVAKPAAEQYLLLIDGRLIRGVVGRDPGGYTVAQKIGVLRYPERKVERAFDSVEAAYRYRLERIPEDDPAERLRLARWCLTLHLDKEAMTLLEQVVEISPNHVQARSMLAGLRQTEASRLARAESKVDEGVLKTSGADIADDRPGALDASVLAGAGRRMGITGLPVIFDLPPAMAVRRTEQFKQYVHPVLQAYCARCHNAEFPGDFQLVTVRTPRQRTPDALRTNLDAALRHIDRENPAKSELLSTVLLPHGGGSGRRPVLIFSGSNDRAFQVLSTWVNSLQPPGRSESSAASGMVGEADESFAVGRHRPGTEPLDQIARGRRPGDPRQPTVMGNPATQGPGRAYRFVEGQGMVPEDPSQADPREFPLPYMLGGPRPKTPGDGAARPAGRIPPPLPAPTNRPVAGVPATPTTPEDDADVPPLPDRPASRRSDPATAKKSKPVSIDPRILEKLLQRNANR